MTDQNQSPDPLNQQDDTDADAFAVLGLLVILAAAIVFYLTH
jgi:hypothetical protein